MPINKENMDFLFDTLSYYANEYNDVADSCFNDVTKALNEICKQYLVKQNVSVLPYGSYAIKSNYQVLEPMEFYLVLPKTLFWQKNISNNRSWKNARKNIVQ